MTNTRETARSFLSEVASEEKINLYNDLLSILKIHEKNQHVEHYSLRKLRRASHRQFDDKKKVFYFKNRRNDELIIQQIQEQHWFKCCYSIQIHLNGDEIDFSVIEGMISALRADIQSQQIDYAMA